MVVGNALLDALRWGRPLAKKMRGRAGGSSMNSVAQVKVMRRLLRLTQEEFAIRFRIPLETLRLWETGKTEPDAVSRAYLTAIARDPEGMRKALASSAPAPRF